MPRARPTLRRRLAVQICLLVVGPLLIAAAAFRGIAGLHQDLGVALRGYRELRELYQVGFHVVLAKSALHATPPDRVKALLEMRSAARQLDQFSSGRGEPVADALQPGGPPDAGGPEPWLVESRAAETVLRAGLAEAVVRLDVPAAEASFGSDPTLQAAAVERVLGQIVNLNAQIRRSILDRQHDAEAKRAAALWAITAFSLAVAACAIVIGVRQYRGVVRPLDRLTRGVREVAAGQFQGRIAPAGDREFAALAEEFNRMAERLDALYRDLERQVEIKSRELVRSERLASVGYLAAGVAHEINNPLGIVSGYGEHALQLLREWRAAEEQSPGSGPDSSLDTIEKTLRVVIEEAFRGKGITGRLLSLARPGDEDRRPTSLAAIASEVVGVVGGFPRYAGRAVTLEASADDHTAGRLSVLARDGEMKQVVLNLVLNALDALTTPDGQVCISVTSVEDAGGPSVELAVADDGAGMDAATAERAFEPFFTRKRGGDEGRGTGLGLSITHAIVQAHGGSIRSESAGPGLGSRFTVRLPACANAPGAASKIEAAP